MTRLRVELRKGLMEVMFVSENCKARGAFKDQGKSAPGEGETRAKVLGLKQLRHLQGRLCGSIPVPGKAVGIELGARGAGRPGRGSGHRQGISSHCLRGKGGKGSRGSAVSH